MDPPEHQAGFFFHRASAQNIHWMNKGTWEKGGNNLPKSRRVFRNAIGRLFTSFTLLRLCLNTLYWAPLQTYWISHTFISSPRNSGHAKFENHCPRGTSIPHPFQYLVTIRGIKDSFYFEISWDLTFPFASQFVLFRIHSESQECIFVIIGFRDLTVEVAGRGTTTSDYNVLSTCKIPGFVLSMFYIDFFI